MALFISGRLPVERKFNLYALPSIAILIIFYLNNLLEYVPFKNFAVVLITLLYSGLIGNIFTTAINYFLVPEYTRRMEIFAASENAIIKAQKSNLPIIVTAEVGYPDRIMECIPNLSMIPPAAIFESFPAYNASRNLPVYSTPSHNEIHQTLKQLPPSYKSVLVVDGSSYWVVNSANY